MTQQQIVVKNQVWNVDLKKKRIWRQVDIFGYDPYDVDAFVDLIRDLASKFDDPCIETRIISNWGEDSAVLSISGWQDMTFEEQDLASKEIASVNKRKDDYDRKLYEQLKERYGY